jgi:hypothetical protein
VHGDRRSTAIDAFRQLLGVASLVLKREHELDAHALYGFAFGENAG